VLSIRRAGSCCVGIAALGEVADVADVSRKARIKEVGRRARRLRRPFQNRARLDRLAEGQFRALKHVVAIDRLGTHAIWPGDNLQEVPQLIGEGGRR